MSRPVLTDEERETRRRARVQASFAESAYRHAPDDSPFGSFADWLDAAETLAGGTPAPKRARAERGPSGGSSIDIRLLNLSALPVTADELRSAFRAAAFSAHPDQGGTAAAFTALYAAYVRLLRLYR